MLEHKDVEAPDQTYPTEPVITQDFRCKEPGVEYQHHQLCREQEKPNQRTSFLRKRVLRKFGTFGGVCR
jgi:hypothetical protein